jgi:subtilisin family serine protease
MNISKNAKFMILLAGFLFQVAPKAFASPESDITREKANVEKILKQKFSYTGNVNGSYGFMGKLIDPEDIEAHHDLAEVLKKISYPRSLDTYTSLYISTESDKSAKTYDKDKSLMIIGKKIDPIQVIKLFSANPGKEISFQGLIKVKLEDSANTLDAYIEPEMLDVFMSIVNIRCNTQIKDMKATKAAMLAKDFESVVREPMDLSKLPESHRVHYAKLLKDAHEAEKMTLRFERSSVDSVALQFQKEALAINLSSKQESQTVSFSLSAACEYENLMIRTLDSDIVKSVYHFDKDLKVTKKVLNNQTRLRGKNINKNTTPVATLDSGLDYNHPSVVESLMRSELTGAEASLYEASKKHFINDVEIKAKLREKRAKVVFDSGYSKTSIERTATRLDSLIKEKNEILQKQKELEVQREEAMRTMAQDQVTVKSLEADKLIMFKPAKQAQVRKLKTKISSAKFSIESGKNEIESLNKRFIDGEKYLTTTVKNHKETIEEDNSIIARLAAVETEEAAHEKMLNIFTRGVTAWNFHDDNDTPSDFWDGASSVLFTSYDHGTHVAGIILNEVENELSILPMRYPKQPHTDINDSKDKKVYQAVELAYKKGVRVLNISMGTFAPESTNFEEKVKNDKAARDSWRSLEKAAKDFPDMLFVCAAGNDGKNTDERGHYPSSFESSNIMSIAAVDKNNVLAEFSNYGKRTVDFAAPGVDIVSLVPNGEVGIKSGTSMATPFVSRVAGRIENINPKLTPEDIKEIIASTLKKTKELQEKTLFGGAIDEDRAIAKACSSISLAERISKSACKTK